MSGAVDDSTAKHLPECPVINGAVCPHDPRCNCQCMCKMLRACEQRVRMEDDDYAYVAAQAEADGRWRGWADALDAAREAVEAQKVIPLAKTGKFIITRNTRLWNDRQSWAEYGWWEFRRSALAAIDALREDNDKSTEN